MDLNTKISELTVGELTAVIRAALEMESNPEYVSGIEGLAQLFQVSYSQAKRIKASGLLDKAISQCGRTILTDVRMAREIYYKAAHGRRN